MIGASKVRIDAGKHLGGANEVVLYKSHEPTQ
jgi:hypothetical protein